MTISPLPARSAIQSSAASIPEPAAMRSISGSCGTRMNWPATTLTGSAMPGRDAVNLVLDRAGIGVDIDAGACSNRRHRLRMRWGARQARSRCAWYPIGRGIASKTGCGNTLATAFSSRTISSAKQDKNQGKQGMTSRLETYRVQAYNTAKLSENKMHDDTVAKPLRLFRRARPRRRCDRLHDAPAGGEMGPRVSRARADRGAFRQTGL